MMLTKPPSKYIKRSTQDNKDNANLIHFYSSMKLNTIMERISLSYLRSMSSRLVPHLVSLIYMLRSIRPPPHELGLPSLARSSLVLLQTSLPQAFGIRGRQGGRPCASPFCHSTEPPVVDMLWCVSRLSLGPP